MFKTAITEKSSVGAHITPTDNQSRNNAEKNKFSFSLIDI